ncbi:MAG: hypothetical protein JSV51_05630 [Candidatus Bathyarchaeota archaeon]|nr:MAG: hypothetical protein JSV51_05630 [Candidatus Bathyarchaeota archaeon]UCH32268.1 MAG: hypothetical protein JSV05_02490 [Candidatus Bathyarchaeota archaeon]
MRRVILVSILFLLMGLSVANACNNHDLVEDVNEDGIVDIGDLILVGEAFASYPGHPRWNVKADVDGSNFVDIGDVIQVMAAFGSMI